VSEELLLGTSYAVFIGVTLIFMCGCAMLMGRAQARAWRPVKMCVLYAILLGLADRFLIATLFGGEWRSVTGFFIDTYVIILAALVSYRLTLAAQMVRQYPWLYRRRFLFAWKKR